MSSKERPWVPGLQPSLKEMEASLCLLRTSPTPVPSQHRGKPRVRLPRVLLIPTEDGEEPEGRVLDASLPKFLIPAHLLSG